MRPGDLEEYSGFRRSRSRGGEEIPFEQAVRKLRKLAEKPRKRGNEHIACSFVLLAQKFFPRFPSEIMKLVRDAIFNLANHSTRALQKVNTVKAGESERAVTASFYVIDDSLQACASDKNRSPQRHLSRPQLRTVRRGALTRSSASHWSFFGSCDLVLFPRCLAATSPSSSRSRRLLLATSAPARAAMPRRLDRGD